MYRCPISPVRSSLPAGHRPHRHEQAEAAGFGGRGQGVRLGRSPDAHLCGLRRRGYTPESIRNFCDRIGVAKVNSTVEYGFLEHCLREDLNEKAQRAMAVLRPVKLIITNYPEGQSETFPVENNPNDPEAGTREVTFSRELYWRPMTSWKPRCPSTSGSIPAGPECRLKGAYLITCTGCEKDEKGNITAITATYDPNPGAATLPTAGR